MIEFSTLCSCLYIYLIFILVRDFIQTSTCAPHTLSKIETFMVDVNIKCTDTKNETQWFDDAS